MKQEIPSFQPEFSKKIFRGMALLLLASPAAVGGALALSRAENHTHTTDKVEVIDVNRNDLSITDTSTMRQVNLTNSPEASEDFPQISPNGQSVFFLERNPTSHKIIRHNLFEPGTEVVFNFSEQGQMYRGMAISPDQKYLALHTSEIYGNDFPPRIFVIDLETLAFQKVNFLEEIDTTQPVILVFAVPNTLYVTATQLSDGVRSCSAIKLDNLNSDQVLEFAPHDPYCEVLEDSHPV